MQINQDIKRKLVLAVIILIFVNVISCDFEVNTNDSADSNEIINNKVKVNLEVAKTLSNMAITNEKLIVLSQLKNEENNLKNILVDIEHNQQNIKSNLTEFAEQKLVLLPTKYDTLDVEYLKNNDSAYLKHVEQLLRDEINQLKNLSKLTNDLDFKLFSLNTLVSLNYNINQIQNKKLLTIK